MILYIHIKYTCVHIKNPAYTQSRVYITLNMSLSHETYAWKLKLPNNYVKLRNKIALGILILGLHLLIHNPQQEFLKRSF